jgi:hypothetical protein
LLANFGSFNSPEVNVEVKSPLLNVGLLCKVGKLLKLGDIGEVGGVL